MQPPPLTGAGVVDTVITDRARFKIEKVSCRLRLTALAPGETIDAVLAITAAPLDVALQ